MEAAPIKQWTWTSWAMIIPSIAALIFWTLNSILDNEGGWYHWIFLRFSQIFFVVPIVYWVAAYKAYDSYGS
jgi:NADH:ubiquinone oxidoreductase subunit 4 (subunit M)